MADAETTDIVIIGSGAGALCAALRARSLGADTLVLEKEPMVGGNSALSGGTMWVPANSLMKEAGIPDSIDEAMRYLDACVGDAGPATSRERKLAYLGKDAGAHSGGVAEQRFHETRRYPE